MPVTFGVSVAWPDGMLGTVDVRQTFRDGPGHVMRRELQKIVDKAASATPFNNIASAYEIHQGSSGDLSFDIVNTAFTWTFAEFPTVAHWMPWASPDSRIAGWMEMVGIENTWWNRLNIAKKIAAEGTKGYGIFQTVWDANIDEALDNIAASALRWAERWGQAGAE